MMARPSTSTSTNNTAVPRPRAPSNTGWWCARHLVRERGYDQNMMVTFELGSNGLLSIGPRNAWSLDWQPGSLELEGSG